jgi:3-oxoadipate enol-lactonase
LHMADEGRPDDPPLVFVNSLGTDLRSWEQVAGHFAATHRVIRYDKRGHGLSDCPPAPYTIRDHTLDLVGLLDRLEVARAAVVGISIGGMIAQDLAAAWPERVSELVLCDTAPKIGTAAAWQERSDTLCQHGMAYLAETILTRWFAPSFAERQPATYRGYLNMLVRMPLEGYTGTCDALQDADLTAATRTIAARTLVVCGAQDVATPPELVRGLWDLLPEATYREIPGSAHLPCVEQPAALAAEIEAFLGVRA